MSFQPSPHARDERIRIDGIDVAHGHASVVGMHNVNPKAVTDPDHAVSMLLEEVMRLQVLLTQQSSDSPYNLAITQFVFSGHLALPSDG